MPIRENKFARQAEQRKALQKSKRGGAAADNQPTVDEQLKRLDEDIRRLKIEFDIYFNGAAKRPPYDTKSRIETMFKRLGDDRTLSFAQRYLFNSLTARYTSFRELWRRTMQGREEGRDAAQAARANARDEASQREAAQTFICDDAHRDVPTVKQLYDALIEAKMKCGEPTDDLSFPRFHHLIATKTDTLKERTGCDRVRFSIDVEGGRVSFKAKGE
ncbi:MAG TPA: MXAN_5187 C-terminal domain-containing protein [Pyrinomonadaceae bacterium]|nr:MXAN_5187 C-terminal domain-containing protein [Pyrinomonadaceae bacterium]